MRSEVRYGWHCIVTEVTTPQIPKEYERVFSAMMPDRKSGGAVKTTRRKDDAINGGMAMCVGAHIAWGNQFGD